MSWSLLVDDSMGLFPRVDTAMCMYVQWIGLPVFTESEG